MSLRDFIPLTGFVIFAANPPPAIAATPPSIVVVWTTVTSARTTADEIPKIMTVASQRFIEASLNSRPSVSVPSGAAGDGKEDGEHDRDVFDVGRRVDVGPLVGRVTPAAGAAAADRDGRDAQAHRDVRVGAADGEVGRQPERPDHGRRGLHDRRVHPRLAARALADHLRIRRDASFLRRPRPVLPVDRLANDGQNRLVDLFQLAAGLGREVDVHADLGGNRVDRRPAADDADAVGRLRRRGHLEVADLRDRSPHRESRIHQTERAVAVAAGPLERDAVPLAADTGARDAARLVAVDRDHLPDAILVLALRQQVLDAAQVPLAFLADVADKEDVARHRELRRVERPDEREDEREPTRVVADAGRHETCPLTLHLDVGAFGEHGVQVGVDHEHRSARGSGAAANAHDVAFGVHLDVGKPLLPQHLQKRLRAGLLLEGGRRDFGQRDQLAHEAVLVGLDERDRLLELRAIDDATDPGIRRLGHRRRDGHGEKRRGYGCTTHGDHHKPRVARNISATDGAESTGVSCVPWLRLDPVRGTSVAVLLALAVSAARQRAPLRSSVEVTVVTATVRDANGKLVTGLPKEAFEVYEDGERLPIAQFTNERVPLGLGLLLDISDSMFGRRIKDAEAAVEDVLLTPLDSSDAFFVMAFNHSTSLLFGWKTDPSGVHEALAKLQPTGSTAIYDALVRALPFIDSRPRERAAIVLITDGADTASDTSLHD